jgi:hypothetical protein
VPLDQQLIVGCSPDDMPAGRTTSAVVIARPASVEDALKICRPHLSAIRGVEGPSSDLASPAVTL